MDFLVWEKYDSAVRAASSLFNNSRSSSPKSCFHLTQIEFSRWLFARQRAVSIDVSSLDLGAEIITGGR